MLASWAGRNCRFEVATPGGPGNGPWPFLFLLVFASAVMLDAPNPFETQAAASAPAERMRQGMGGSSMWEPQTGSLLVEYYEMFLGDRDLEQFRDRVLARYTEGTLGAFLTSSPSVAARRAAVLALGVTGSFEQSNSVLGRAMRDTDPVVRTMAEMRPLGRLVPRRFPGEQRDVG